MSAKFSDTIFAKLARDKQVANLTELLNSMQPNSVLAQSYSHQSDLPNIATSLTTHQSMQQLQPTKALTHKRIEKKYGLTKSSIHWHLVHIFHVSPKLREALSSYFILHYTGKQFSTRNIDGIITIADADITKDYLVVYDGCTPVVAKKAHTVILSFRSALSEIGIPYNYVIVRINEERKLDI